MITYAEALRLLLSEAKPIEETETIPLMYSTGRVLAEDIASPIDVPGWDNSQMDGYALRVEDIASGCAGTPAGGRTHCCGQNRRPAAAGNVCAHLYRRTASAGSGYGGAAGGRES